MSTVCARWVILSTVTLTGNTIFLRGALLLFIVGATIIGWQPRDRKLPELSVRQWPKSIRTDEVSAKRLHAKPDGFTDGIAEEEKVICEKLNGMVK
jgi:hypothetical protein